MKQISVIAFSLFIGVFLSVGVISDVQAKRLGGGKSFGSSVFQNKTAKRTNSQPNKSQQQNTDRKQALSKKGGMMGLLGGLMIGGMIGALFFGGAFENINFMDILLFGGIAFLLFKLLTRRKQQQAATANGTPIDIDDANNYQARQSSINYGSADDKPHEEPENILKTGKIPRSFDQKSFLSGAENVYELLQKAWDNGDLGDLRQFCTDNVFAEIQDQFHARNSNNKTEIVSLKSELVNIEISDNSTAATVVFNVELKEFDNIDKPDEITHIQEAWYFIRPNNKNEHNWLLDGIQQVED